MNAATAADLLISGTVTTPPWRAAWHWIVRLFRPAARALTAEERRLAGELAAERAKVIALVAMVEQEREEAEKARRRLSEDLDIARGQLRVREAEIKALADLHELSLARVQAALASAAIESAIPEAMARQRAGQHGQAMPGTLAQFAAGRAG